MIRATLKYLKNTKRLCRLYERQIRNFHKGRKFLLRNNLRKGWFVLCDACALRAHKLSLVNLAYYRSRIDEVFGRAREMSYREYWERKDAICGRTVCAQCRFIDDGR